MQIYDDRMSCWTTNSEHFSYMYVDIRSYGGKWIFTACLVLSDLKMEQ